MHQFLNYLRKEGDVFAITQQLATRSLHVKKLYIFNTPDEHLRIELKVVPFFGNHNSEFMVFTAEDESNQRNRMRIIGLILHFSFKFLHSF